MLDYSQAPQMNASDLFMAQNLGMNPQMPMPMSGMQSPLGMPQQQMPQSMPMSGPQNVQPSPEVQHIGDVINQYVQNKQGQNDSSGLVQQILSNRMQPTLADASRSVFQSNQNGPGPNGYYSPEEAMADRYKTQLAPYTQGLGLVKTQAETGLANAQAGYYGNALQRDLAEKDFEYQNDPQMAQARIMGQLLSQYTNGGQPAQGAPSNAPMGFGGMSTPNGPILPQVMQKNGTAQPSNGQPGFNPVGTMLGKMFGLPEGMQIGPNGQPAPIPGIPTKGQQDQDGQFAQSWQTYINEGGDKRLQNSLDTIDKVIDGLNNGKIKTGGMMSRAMTSPEGQPIMGSQLFNSDALVARNLIASAILPQAKALFGARVTNFDAQSLISSQGLDPMADNQTNIDKLTRLRNATVDAQKDLNASGNYFMQHGTLAGYQPVQNAQIPLIQSPNDPAFQKLPSGSQFTTPDGRTLVKH